MNRLRAAVLVGMVWLDACLGLAGGVVTNCTESALRTALVGGGLVTIACDGKITLSNTLVVASDTQIQGGGHEVTISGADAIGLFQVRTNATLELVGLTLANGQANGGAICNLGTVNAIDCTFRSNSAVATAWGGGAIFNDFVGTLNIDRCTFSQNSAIAGQGSPASGGAIYNAGAARVTACVFFSNSVIGSAGHAGMHGMNNITFGGNGGDGAPGSDGVGGALFNSGNATLLNCTLAQNTAAGGPGGTGGQGGDGIALYHEPTMGGGGGIGGRGGNGVGAALACSGFGVFHLTNCTVAANWTSAGMGGGPGMGGWGQRVGYAGGPGPNGGPGTVGGMGPALAGSGIALLNTLLDANGGGGNGPGTNLDLGHNLSSDNTCVFTNHGSLNNTQPRLGPLVNNGGPTLTMALLQGSPAVDAGDTATAPVTDQRGFPRAGRAADIGAYELAYPPVLRLNPPQGGTIGVRVYGTNGLSFQLLTSSDLSRWTPVVTNQIGSDETILIGQAINRSDACRFYRVAMP